MKKLLFLVLMAGAISGTDAQTCSTCGQLNASSLQGKDFGPIFSVSLGTAQFHESAGHLTFSSSSPDPNLFTPAALQFSAPSRTNIDVTVLTTNELSTNIVSVVLTNSLIVSNISYVTNFIGLVPVIDTNIFFDQELVPVTNTTTTVTTIPAIRQVIAPQALADIPVPPTANGYIINFYFTNQISGQNSDGTYQVSGTPFVTWMITNSASLGANYQIQISKYGNVPSYGLMKQWTYSYSTNDGAWTNQPLGNLSQEVTWITNLNANAYQVVDLVQSPSGAVVQQTKTTYTNTILGVTPFVAPIEVDVGSNSVPQTTTYTYNASGQVQTVTHPDGSWEYYASYDGYGNPLTVYSSFEDAPVNSASARETIYNYSTSFVSGSGDAGTNNPTVPRQTIQYINGNIVSLSYTAFPNVSERLDIQCTNTSASWNSAGNLITTNFFYASGPNQFRLRTVVHSDGTLTTYNYLTNGSYETNIVVSGQPDTYGTNYVVDGVSNVTVLNNAGYNVSVSSYDVKTGIALSRDTSANFDSYGRPQQVTHIDGTTEYTSYACCGLDQTTDRDGLTTQYLYDPAKRQIGYQKNYGSGAITYTNLLDPASRVVQSIRVGSDGTPITMSQSAYDLAGELIAQTNALTGATTYTRTTNSSTGGLIRTISYPNSGTVTNYYYADGSLKETIGNAVHGLHYLYGAANGYTYTVEIKLNASGGDTGEINTNFTDMLGRTYKTAYASASGVPASFSYYNSKGQLASQVDPDGVTNLYAYNAKGELAYTAIDMNGNGSIDFSGTDRITQTTNDVTTGHGINVRRSRTFVWLDGQSAGTLVSSNETSVDGLTNWLTTYRDTSTPVTSTNEISYSSPSRTLIAIAPDGTYTINSYSYGRLVSSTRYNSGGTQIGGATYTFDPHGRQSTVTDARNGTTTYGYNNADLVTSVTTPNPGTIGTGPETTLTGYNTSLQPISVTQPDGTMVYSAYLLTGELGLQYGSRIYPVAYNFDYAGRMQTMTNWSSYPASGARVTTWKYDGYRGWLTNKVFDGNTAGPSYAYTAAGRLAARKWVRTVGGQPLTTTYNHNTAGDVTNIFYNDGVTPSVTNTFDRLGRLTQQSTLNSQLNSTYNLANQLLGESFSGGILNGLAVTNGYDSDLRRTTLVALQSNNPLIQQSFGYDTASRLSTVTDGNNNSATYSYLANSPLVSQITFKQSGTTRMTTSKQFDYLNRLTSISSSPSSSSSISYAYAYNSANQRTRNTLADGSYWLYQYDSLGQVTSGCKYWSDGTPVAGQQFDYNFDNIGNRAQTQSGGDATGANLRVANYSANNLNQITSRDVPGYVDVKGVSFATNTVTVNGTTAYRKTEYFRDELAVNNSSSALWTNMVITATSQTSVTGNVYVAQTPEQFSYDADGNLTNDGRFSWTWDGENRLIDLTSLNSAPTGSKVKLDFLYDPQGRRIQKIVSTNNGTSYVAQYTNRFLYDGWNLIAVLNPSSSLVDSFMWGSDLSGSQQGAGGVGGLLEATYYGSSTTNCFPAFDGNGNVMAYINAVDGTSVAQFDYGPFGEVIRATGPMAQANPIRWSTKYQDDESDLIMYPYRPYKASTGTWLSRDPLEEQGGLNLYSFCDNDAIDNADPFGETPTKYKLGKIEITINLSDDGCKIKEIDVRYGIVGGQVAKLHASGDVNYAVNCEFYNTSGDIPINVSYTMSPPPTWFQRKREKDVSMNEHGKKSVPLCCSCTLNLSWNVAVNATVIVNF
jgi:RHS repeat-associated protein